VLSAPVSFKIDCILGVPAQGKSGKTSDYYADDYYNADDEYADEANEQEKVVHRNPKFISQTTNQLVNEGETIKLPCLADKLGKLGYQPNVKESSTLICQTMQGYYIELQLLDNASKL